MAFDTRTIKRLLYTWGIRVLSTAFLWYLYVWLRESQPFRSIFLQIVMAGTFLLFWVGFQMFLFVWFMARTRQETYLPGQAGLVTLASYWGQPKILETIEQWVVLLRGVKKYRDMGGLLPKGMLLIGPPGSGKSFLAKCLAGSAGIPFMSMDASSLRSMWMGMGSIKIMMLFRKAKKLASLWGASIVYIDEVDAIGMSRIGVERKSATPHLQMVGGMGMGGGGGELNTLLYELDGSMDRSLIERLTARVAGFLGIELPPPDRAVFCIAATNVPVQMLDSALTRSGRLNRVLPVGRPDRPGRKDILVGYLEKVSHVLTPSDIEELVDETAEMTPADIKLLVQEEAPRKALFAGHDRVEPDDFVEALREVQVGLKNPISFIDPQEREKLAVHEAGHTVLQWTLTDHRVSTTTIIRYGDALGHMMPVETRDRTIRTLNETWADLVIGIGGRAGEIMVYGEPMQSVGGDYPHVLYGIEKLLASGLWGTPVGTQRENSIRVRAMFDQALTAALKVLHDHKDIHWRLVEALQAKDTLRHDEVVRLFGERHRITIPNPVEPRIGRKQEEED